MVDIYYTMKSVPRLHVMKLESVKITEKSVMTRFGTHKRKECYESTGTRTKAFNDMVAEEKRHKERMEELAMRMRRG